MHGSSICLPQSARPQYKKFLFQYLYTHWTTSKIHGVGKFRHKIRRVEITEYIRDKETVAVFLLLGSNLQFPPPSARVYTHNWVIFEAGVAAGERKRIWVFEDFKDNIKFPVPFVTDYSQYTLWDTSHLRYFGHLFRNQFIDQRVYYQPKIVTCPYETCNAIYQVWSDSHRFFCPVCRGRIPRDAGSDRDRFFPISIAQITRLPLQLTIDLGNGVTTSATQFGIIVAVITVSCQSAYMILQEVLSDHLCVHCHLPN